MSTKPTTKAPTKAQQARITKAQATISATWEDFHTHRKAGEGKALTFVKAVITALLAGYIVDGTAMDAAGILGGKEATDTAPFRSRTIGKNGIVTLVRESGLKKITAEQYRVLAAYWQQSGKGSNANTVREALGMALEVKEGDTSPNGETAQETGAEATLPAEMTPAQTADAFVALAARIAGLSLSKAAEARVTEAAESLLAEFAVRSA